jgi:type II secretory pathway pseudopilin PulG
MRKMYLQLHKQNSEKGFILPALLSAMIALSIILVAVFQIIASNYSFVNTSEKSQLALNISEAGINYYLWHLSHNSTDYQDGVPGVLTPNPTLGYGPFTHTYIDDNGVNKGNYTLWIKPQGGGSTIATIRSIGATLNGITRTVEAKIGAPSFTSYAVASDSAIWFGNTEVATGPVHSNQGIRMDGPANADVTSAVATYVPPSNLGGNGSSSRPGVWCDTNVTSPVNCSTRSKVDWRFAVPAIDFNIVVGSLCSMKKSAFSTDVATASLAALSTACTQTPTTRTPAYIPQVSTSGAYSNTKGYLIELNNNGTYNLSRVSAENDTLSTYATALTRTSVATAIPIPTTGVIFVEDNVWLRTNPNFSGRVTIGAARLATSSSANITVADDVLYSTKNGSDAIGLVAENSFLIAPYAAPASGAFTFEVDAAVIAQSADVLYQQFYKQNSSCTRGWVASNQSMVFYGAVATRQLWTWLWQRGGSCGDAAQSGGSYYSGFLSNTTEFDYNLQYSPPPQFPTTSTFNVLSWQEVITAP